MECRWLMAERRSVGWETDSKAERYESEKTDALMWATVPNPAMHEDTSSRSIPLLPVGWGYNGSQWGNKTRWLCQNRCSLWSRETEPWSYVVLEYSNKKATSHHTSNDMNQGLLLLLSHNDWNCVCIRMTTCFWKRDCPQRITQFQVTVTVSIS